MNRVYVEGSPHYHAFTLDASNITEWITSEDGSKKYPMVDVIIDTPELCRYKDGGCYVIVCGSQLYYGTFDDDIIHRFFRRFTGWTKKDPNQISLIPDVFRFKLIHLNAIQAITELGKEQLKVYIIKEKYMPLPKQQNRVGHEEEVLRASNFPLNKRGNKHA
jgi:hypothetical protein